MQNLIPANKNATYKIKENEKGFYHLKFIVEHPASFGPNKVTNERFQIFSPRDFEEFLKHKKLFAFKSEEIIHDPTLVVNEEVKRETSSDPHDVEEAEERPKKQAYFGSDKWRADIEAKKQLKKDKQ
jgi:hypothetical protein